MAISLAISVNHLNPAKSDINLRLWRGTGTLGIYRNILFAAQNEDVAKFRHSKKKQLTVVTMPLEY